MRLLALIFLLAITNLVNAQTPTHRCSTDEVHAFNYDNDEDYRHAFDVRKVQLDAIRAASQLQGRLDCTNPIIVPVAVHYEGVSTQAAACLEQLALSQIDALNADYSATNSDITNYCVDVDNTTLDPAALASNGACIIFCLATQNHPAGLGLNNGDYAITTNQGYGNFTATWSGYLNFFVQQNTGILGLSPLFGNANGDGVMVDACAFGVQGSGCGDFGPGTGCANLDNYNLGRTATHELGHYLGLEHIWGGGAGGCGQDDGIADTPNSTQEYYSCPAQGSASCGSDDMYMNYMDYVDDACMYMFSEGQATLMFNTASTLWTTSSNKCLGTPSYPLAVLPNGCSSTDCSPIITGALSFCVGSCTDLDAGIFSAYQWSTGETTQIINVCNSGTYTVITTDGNGCTGTGEVTVTENPLPVPVIAGSTLLCVGDCTDLDAGIFSAYQWSIGETTQTINVCSEGTYTVTITDANGCTGIDEIEILEVSPISISTTSTPESCATNDGSATITDTNGGNYEYIWNDGNTGGTNSNIEAGTYTVTITDLVSGCTATETIIVGSDCGCGNMIATAQIINHVSCFGECDGIATASATGGNGNYTYSWENGFDQATANNLCAGIYVVTVSDSDGCSAIIDIVVEEPNEIMLTLAVTPESCAENDGVITATIGGNATFVWSNGFTDNSISGLTAGTYTVTATDMTTQCTATETVIVEDDCGCGNMLAFSQIVNHVSCFGECNGVATASATGGNGNYTYSWENGFDQATANNLCAGIYVVTVSDSDGCSAIIDIVVEEPNEIIITLAATTESCAENDGTITATTGGNATFVWSNGFTDNSISGLTAGTYTVTATDMTTQCTATQAVVVGNGCNCATIIAESQVISNVTCFDECNGFAMISASGGTGIFTYLWNNGATQASEDNLCAGTYVVTVSDSDGCTAITDLIITEPDPIIVTTTSIPESCATNDGTAFITNSNGGNYTYLWSDGNTGGTNSNIEAATYIVTITDINSQCTAIETIIVENSCGCDGTLTYSLNNISPTGCLGICDGSIGGIGDGGTAPYTYLWSDGQTVDSPENLCPGDYTLTVTDAAGCTYNETFFVEESTGFTLAAASTDETCTGNDGTAFVTTSGVNVTFAWSNGESGNVVDGLSAGTYIVTATDATGCTAIETVIVEEDCGCDFIVVEITINNPSCPGDCNGSALAESDITNGASYEWSTGEIGSVISNLCSGIYTVTATDSDGCTGVSSIVINDPNPIQVIMSGNDANCGVETGSVSVSVTGGTAPFTYNWNNGNTNGFQEELNSGTYAVTVTDVNGCSETGSVTITGSPSISVIGIETDVSCGGESDGAINVTVTGGTPPFLYDWNNGEVTEDLTAIPTGTYVLFVTDAEGCGTGTSFTVSGAPELTIDMQVTGNTGGDNGSILAGTTGGSAPYTWQWSNGESGVFIDELANGTYTVIVTDANGCTAEASATILTTTSTLDPNLVIDWSVYPNPSNGLFQLSMNLVEKEDVSIRIINILGQTIFATEQNTDNLSQTIDLQEFSKGTYFLEIRVKESRVVEKLMLVK